MDPALPPGAPARPAAEPSASGPVAVGAVLLLAGFTLLWQAVSTAAGNGVTLGGPTLAPLVVTGLWVVVAAWYLLDAVRKRVAAPEHLGRAAWRTPALLLVALIVYSVVLKYTVLGYVLATAAFVLVSARLLSTRPWREVIVRDLATAAGLSLGIYLIFTRLLGIVLPAGVLPL
ncbi:tripartite tricarboxylate transporter TctB family protein [Actinoplanes sp. NPDC023801]|uniref:tripartite tricarboxylate transporter TctB family protein n=1 Tax=Actinoplanes sp. NPDC023801 TaxID=3154595 RepID=UPI003404020E